MHEGLSACVLEEGGEGGLVHVHMHSVCLPPN